MKTIIFFLDFMVSLNIKILQRDTVFNFQNSDIIRKFFMNFFLHNCLHF